MSAKLVHINSDVNDLKCSDTAADDQYELKAMYVIS
jgi:hypothetical protein